MKISDQVFPLTFFCASVFLFVFSSNNLYDSTNAVCTPISLGVKIAVFTIVAAILLFLGITSRLRSFSSGLLLSGSFILIVEAFVRGCVMDYWSFFGLFRFNMADIFISTGAILLAYDLLVKKRVQVMYNQLVHNSERS